MERVNLDSTLYNKVDYVSEQENKHYIEYSGIQFSHDSDKIFDIADITEKSKEDVFIGWNGLRLGYVNKYYSNTNMTPLFIYETRTGSVYLRDDYDYQSDVFIVSDTDSNIVFSDALIETDFIGSFSGTATNKASVVIYSELCHRLRINLNVFFEDNEWYAHIKNSGNVYIVTQNFVEILSANKLIFKD